jgi:hypothetical protein
VFASCKKEDDPILDDPDTRLSATLSADEAILSGAANGWRAEIYPVGGKGFSYYLKFNAGKVTMLSDFNSTTAVTPKESTYRLKALQYPTLIFDTYSYLHLPADPDPAISGGTQGKGLTSDFQFYITEISADRIVLLGSTNLNVMVLTKLTPAQEASFLAGAYKVSRDANATYLAANKFPYLQFADGVKIAVAMDPVKKTIVLTWADANDISKTVSSTFAFGLTGFTLNTPLIYGNNTFNEVFYDPATKQYYLMLGTTRVNFQNSTTPVIPFRVVFGAGKDYSQISYNPAVNPTNSVVVATGLSADWNSKYATAKTGLAAVGGAGRTLDWVAVLFPIDAPTQMVLRFYYHNTAGSNFQANMTYSFTKNANGEYDFTYLASDGNAGVVGGGLVAIKDYFDQNVFRADWVANPSGGASYGGLYVVSNPSSFYYGTLVK